MKTQHLICGVIMVCSCASADDDQNRQRAMLEGIVSYDLQRFAGTDASKSIHVFDMRTKRGTFQLRWVRPSDKDMVNAPSLAHEQVKAITEKWCKAHVPVEIIEEAAHIETVQHRQFGANNELSAWVVLMRPVKTVVGPGGVSPAVRIIVSNAGLVLCDAQVK